MHQAPVLSLSQARRALAARQGLGRSTPQALGESISSLGWIPAISSATAPLALHARGAWPGRRAFADAFTREELVIAPGPRGLPWIVPAIDAPLARAFALADHASREARVASSCGVTARDLASARDALRRALDVPSTPAMLGACLDVATLRPLDASARRIGFSTLAGLVLRALWIQGEVVASPAPVLDARDVVWRIAPHPRVLPSAAEAVDTLAPRWLAAHAPASVRDFAQAFGIATGRALVALRRLHPQELRVESIDGVLLAPADFVPPDEALDAADARPFFLPVGDPMLDARDRLSLLYDRTRASAAELRQAADAPLVVVAGEIVARWSFELDQVTVRAFGVTPPRIAPEERAAIEDFLRHEVGFDAVQPAASARRGADTSSLLGDIVHDPKR